MTEITFIEPDGTRKTVEAIEGASLMLAATMGGVDGIAAECGGNCVCATCHCLVLEGPTSALSDMGGEEKDTLEFSAEEIFDNSRLTCQLEATPAMNGLVLRVVGK